MTRAVAVLVERGALPGPPIVAFGDSTTRTEEVDRSYRRALAASRVVESVSDDPGVPLGWEDLGLYQLLVHVPPDELGMSPMDERIRRLADKPELLQTLETYLELAGDAKRTTEVMTLHRASLYYRLGKAEEIAELDLKLGADRVAAYLSIKSLRLAGRLA